MKIAIIQQSASRDPVANRKKGVRKLKEAAREGAQLVVFPELAFLPFFPQKPAETRPLEWSEPIPGPTTDLFSTIARDHGVVTVLNLYESDGRGATYDSSPVMDADGSLLGVARMVHITDAPCFHEQDYYTPGDSGAPVFETRVGRMGVAICYDRHFPEYVRALGLKGADLVVVPQAGAVDEWPPGLFEAELQVAAFQNGYFAALANRVGEEECLTFAGESYVADPFGRVIARAPAGEEAILYAELNLSQLKQCPARRQFLPDRRPDIEL